VLTSLRGYLVNDGLVVDERHGAALATRFLAGRLFLNLVERLLDRANGDRKVLEEITEAELLKGPCSGPIQHDALRTIEQRESIPKRRVVCEYAVHEEVVDARK
jgi:hypothetical protein